MENINHYFSLKSKEPKLNVKNRFSQNAYAECLNSIPHVTPMLALLIISKIKELFFVIFLDDCDLMILSKIKE